MSANSKQQSDKEKQEVWKRLRETESERHFREILRGLMGTVHQVEAVSGHKKDEK